ncbi:SDR family NAD(P)-dependent oxidoreductase [Croceicoccus naphthovorans]|uniref:SDR family NAD(P)-dependent oxidoreductase n=1 Tax=Croceicoccus naphthovorans TaxID=1348774 RepID=UPI00069D143A|nr:SDR family oxidoreductase [Croceicoccus naphthovorans]MBB3991516.1 NAD(P)-dependent dehydrogenase (short-subunit alcohol dehydrogenase family) [Croceicoccus naphthovorans]
MSRPDLTLSGNTAVVTGAGSGIGRGLAIAAARRGMAVAICDVNEAQLAETAALVEQAGAVCLARPVDVTNPVANDAFALRVSEQCPPIATLFANAGILRQGSIAELPPAQLRALFDVNVVGTVQTVQSFVPIMRAAMMPAQIVITASTGAMFSYPHLTAYCATKHALWPIADGLRADMEAGPAPIGVSMLMPGPVSTAIFDHSDPGHQASPGSITTDEAAEIAFSGALMNRPYILTHPDFVDQAADHFAATIVRMKSA